jgi:hypothetical protein
MNNRSIRIVPLALACGLALAACADKPTRTHAPAATRATTTTTEAPTSRTSTTTSPARSKSTTRRAAAAAAEDTSLPAHTGIASCDNYLASYKACHRAAGVYAPESIDSRYNMMRTTLLRDSKDDDMRPQLDARCNSLASQLKQALHGKECATDEPANASTATP